MKAFRRWANISILIRIYKYQQADKRIIEKMNKNVSGFKFSIKLGRLSDGKWIENDISYFHVLYVQRRVEIQCG